MAPLRTILLGAFLILPALANPLAALLSRQDYTCSATSPCFDGSCCSQYGYCGYTTAYVSSDFPLPQSF